MLDRSKPWEPLNTNRPTGRRKEIRVEDQPTFAHVADLLFEDVVAIFIHVGAQEVLESVVDLQPGGQHGDPLPHRVALQNHRHRGSCSTSTQHIPSSPSGSVSLPSCPPGSRCSRSCPPPRWRPLLPAQPGVSVGRLDARRPHPRCLEDTAGTFITFTTHFPHNTRRPRPGPGLHIAPNYHDCSWAVYISYQ